MEQAIKKINDEMQKHPDDKLWEFCGTYIIDSMDDNKAVLINNSYSLTEAIKKVTSEAKKVAVNSCGVLTPDNVISAIDEYFRCARNEAAYSNAMLLLSGGMPVMKKPVATIDADFDALFS